jgi:hypothetical protein
MEVNMKTSVILAFTCNIPFICFFSIAFRFQKMLASLWDTGRWIQV